MGAYRVKSEEKEVQRQVSASVLVSSNVNVN